MSNSLIFEFGVKGGYSDLAWVDDGFYVAFIWGTLGVIDRLLCFCHAIKPGVFVGYAGWGEATLFSKVDAFDS
jgi:hypothetical protein